MEIGDFIYSQHDCQIVLSMLSGSNGLNDQNKYRQVLKDNILVNAEAALSAAFPIAASSHWIMKSYGSGFEQGKWVI